MGQNLAMSEVFMRAFRRRTHSFVISLIIISTFFSVFIAVLLAYKLVYPVEPKYYGTITRGRSFPLTALIEPKQSDDSVIEWANQAAILAFNLDFVNYEEQLEQASQYFTAEGWEQFMGSLKESNNIDVIRQKRLTVTAVARNTPVILQKGMLNGIFSWRIQMPILITYQSSSNIVQKNNVVTMLVVRTSTLESYRGIGVSQFNVASALGGMSS